MKNILKTLSIILAILIPTESVFAAVQTLPWWHDTAGFSYPYVQTDYIKVPYLQATSAGATSTIAGSFLIGTTTSAFTIDINGLVGVSGFQAIYMPNQTVIATSSGGLYSRLDSVYFGNGGNLSTTTTSILNPVDTLGFESNGSYNGALNTFVGMYSGVNNGSGNQNTFLGADSGQFNTNGVQNDFLGNYAGHHNTSGYHNTCVGSSACEANTTGYHNVGLGTDSMINMNTGNYNTSTGDGAGPNGSGSSNATYGVGTGQAISTGSHNAAFGTDGLYNLTTGQRDSSLGDLAGQTLLTGTYDTFVGDESDVTPDASTTLNYATALGYLAKVSESSAIVLGNTTIKGVGIGTTSPGAMLDVASGANVNNEPVFQVSYVSAAYATTTRFMVQPTGLVGIGTTPLSLLDVNGGVSIGSYAGTVAAPSNGLIVSGNVGVGTSTPTLVKFEVAGGTNLGTNLTDWIITNQKSDGTVLSGRIGAGSTSANSGLVINSKGTSGLSLNRDEGTGGVSFFGGTATRVAKLGSGGSLSLATTSSGTNNFDVYGNASIGNFGTNGPPTAPSNGLLVSGIVGIGSGTTSPYASLSIQSGASTGDAFAVATSSGSGIGGYDNDGHKFTSGPAGVVSSCGTGSGGVVGDDQSGVITTATAATACTLTFSKAYRLTPVCRVSDDSLVGFADISTISTSTVTFGISSALTGGHLYYDCSYHK